MAAGLLDLGAGGLEVGAGPEGDVDAVRASGVAPGAVVGVLGDAGLAGFDGRVDDRLDLVGGEEAAGGLRVRGSGDERGYSGEGQANADHVGLRWIRCAPRS